MLRKRVPAFLLALGCVCSLGSTALAAEVDSGSVYCFSAEDFSPEEEILGICLTDLPQGLGSVMLGTRVLQKGDILTAQQVSQMTFAPLRSEVDHSVEVGYLPIYQDRVEGEVRMTIGIRGKEDLAPVAEDSAVETYKNLPGTGKLKVSDPEGQAMTFTVVRGPKRGDVTIQEDGTFTYTPKKNKIGVDSFTYTAADPAGKVSREATVTITILKPTESAQYTDTVGMECRFAAEWMKNTGIFVGETVGDQSCFSPDRTVTRGEFVTMLVKALEIPTEEDLVCTGYTDEIPQWLQPYLAAAIRSGLTAGLPNQEVFGAGETITGAEVTVMLQNALDLTAAGEPLPEGMVPVWAEAAAAALEGKGFQLEAGKNVTRGEAAMALYQAKCIQRGA